MRSERRSRAPRGLAGALLALACSGQDVRLGDGHDESPGDPPSSDAASFGEALPIASLSGANTEDDDPSLSADLTEIYFNSQRDGGRGEEDIWTAVRPDPSGDWEEPAAVAALNTESRETGIALAPDALTIWFSSDRSESIGGLDVFVATRTSRGDGWSSPERVDALSTEGDDLVSGVATSERILFLARRSDEDDDYDLFLARRDTVDATWTAAEVLEALNTDAAESDGYLGSDGATFLFTRDEDLFVVPLDGALRPSATATRMDRLNSPEDDRDPWISPDLRVVVFSSNRTGSYMLYEGQR